MAYDSDNLASVLIEMLDYVTSNECTPEDARNYFDEIVDTGLFHDACGKVTKKEIGKVEVATEY